MICTNCGKGELQEITGTTLMICPLCTCKLINPHSQDPVIEINKEFIQDAVRGVSPYYTAMSHPLIKRAGRYDGSHDKWQWDSLKPYTENELKQMYLICKQSWLNV